MSAKQGPTNEVWLIVDMMHVRDALVVCKSRKRAVETLATLDPMKRQGLRLQRAMWTPIGGPELPEPVSLTPITDQTLLGEPT